MVAVSLKSSSHLWHPARRRYQRLPGDGLRAFVADGDTVTLTAVDVWPRVGYRAKYWFDTPTDPLRSEEWRLCSVVARIEPLTTETTPTAATAAIDAG